MKKWNKLMKIIPETSNNEEFETERKRRLCPAKTVCCPYNWKNFCYYEGVCDGNMEYMKNEEKENE